MMTNMPSFGERLAVADDHLLHVADGEAVHDERGVRHLLFMDVQRSPSSISMTMPLSAMMMFRAGVLLAPLLSRGRWSSSGSRSRHEELRVHLLVDPDELAGVAVAGRVHVARAVVDEGAPWR
jgi:hypothetical protein